MPRCRSMSALLDTAQARASQPPLPLVYFGLARSLPTTDITSSLSVVDFYKNRDQAAELRQRGTVRKSSPEDFVTGPVIVYDIYGLLPIDRRLAENYV